MSDRFTHRIARRVELIDMISAWWKKRRETPSVAVPRAGITRSDGAETPDDFAGPMCAMSGGRTSIHSDRTRTSSILPLTAVLSGCIIFVAICFAAFGVWLPTIRESAEAEAWVTHTYQVRSAIQQVLKAVDDAETGQRGFLLTQNADFLEPYDQAIGQIWPQFDALKVLTTDNPSQQSRLSRFHTKLDSKLAILASTIEAAKGGHFDTAVKIVQGGTGKSIMDDLRKIASDMDTEESNLLRTRQIERRAFGHRQNQIALVIAIVTAASLLGVLVSCLLMTLAMAGQRRAERHLGDRQRALEEALKAQIESSEQLEAANRELEGFSYSVSHDLRTPLRAIDGFSRLLIDEHASELGQGALRCLNVVRANTLKMSNLIDDILAFMRTGRIELNRVEVDMEEMVRTTYRELESDIADRSIEIQVGVLPKALGDVAMIKQVFANLLANAIKYSAPNPKALIEVEGHIESGEAVYVVRDNGVGFDMKYVGKLFGVFQRLHGPAEFSGTGIGLSIVKRIITRHGGRVRADGKLHQGATFSFTLPQLGIAYVQSSRKSPNPAGRG